MKRILSVLLVLAMLTALIVLPVSGAEETADTTAPDKACPCGCGLALEQITWEAFDPNVTGGVLSGHYYLEEDYVQNAQLTISADTRTVLDLRGRTLTTKGYHRLYSLNGYLAVLDTVGGGIMCAKTGGDGYGGVVTMTYSDTDGGTKPVFELYSGILTADKDNKGGRRGGLLSVGAKSEFRMYGGMILNGTSNGEKAEAGGCIAATTSSSVVRIEGGKIVGGYAPSHGGNIYSNGGTTILKNCEIIGGKSDANGGNIYQTDGSLTIENCRITDGSAAGSYGGGNLCAQSGAEVEIRDSLIRNGYAAKQGGNCYFASGTQTMENTTLEAGVCGTYGGNLRITSKAVTTVKDCNIGGDVSVSGTLTLQGETKIGLNNNGLNLIYDGATKAISAAGLTDGAEIYVNAGALFTEAGAKAEYFKPALRTVLTETAEGLVGTQAADGEIAGYCPHCGQKVAWQPFELTGATYVAECYLDDEEDTDPACTGRHVATGHYYLPKSYTSFAQRYVGAKQGDVSEEADVVVDLNGYSITATGRPFYIKPTTQVSTLSLLDSVGGSVVTGKGTKDQGGGLIYSEQGNLNIYGGKYVYATGRAVRNGGIFYGGKVTNFYGGIFDASAYTNTGYSGGVFYVTSGKTMNVTAGYFIGGQAKNGGVLHLGYNVKANITGGQFIGGHAADTGGAIAVVGTSTNKNGTILISDVLITGGQADSNSGNLQITYYETARVQNSYIAKGTAGSYAGNIALASNNTYVEYESCLITDGDAPKGGNLYGLGQSAHARLTDCTVIGGTSATNGGNLSAINGYIEIIGGAMIGGVSQDKGGNIYASLGNSEDAPDNSLLLDGGVRITGGSAKEGGNIYFTGVVDLQNAFVHNGKAEVQGQDIRMGKGSYHTALTVGENTTGTVSMYINETLMGSPVYGSTVAGTEATKLNMEITLEGDYGQPRLCASNGALAVSAASVEGNGGKWYATAAEAVAACGENEYVKLYADAALVLEKDCAVDLNGKNVSVSGAYTFCGMDNSGDDITAPEGKAQLSAEVSCGEYYRSPDGRIYIATEEADGFAFHRMNMGISGASIRPGASGIYYTGSWQCDEALLKQVKTYGVAVSLAAMPGDDFDKTNPTAMWTAFDGSELTGETVATGVLISGIMKTEAAGRTAELNHTYGNKPIYATAYVTLASGTTVVSDAPGDEDDVAYSLYTLMCQVEALTDTDPNRYSQYLLPARNFYEKWLDFGMGSWEFAKIPGKADNGILDILFIGNSFTWYGKCVLDKGQNAWSLDNRVNDQGYFYQICKANGVEARVTNFTFGGHQLSDWYTGNCRANRGHNGLDHLRYLTDRDYDYVVLQQGSSGKDAADILAECQPLMDLFLEVNPDTQFVFLVHHRVHLTETAYKANLKDLEDAGILVVDWGALVADVINGTTAVPGATQTYDQNSFVIRKSESDGYHENMLGGYITAQMTFCAITGKSAVGQDYSFCGDKTVNKAFDFDKFLKDEYSYDSATSNFIDIFNSESDMNGLQQLIDQYLAEKAYRNY